VSESKTGNPYIDGEDYFDQYAKGGSEPENTVLEYQTLTYKIFANEDGLKWLQTTKDVLSANIIEFEGKDSALRLAEAQGMRKQILEVFKLLATHQSYINGN
jgi:hypothetical protein